MNILVTGGAGLIGNNLVKRLVEKDHHCVVVDDLSSGNKANLLNIKNVTFYNQTICDRSFLEKIFSTFKIEFVFHLAAFFANQNSVDFPDKDLDVNGLGTIFLLEASVKANVKKFIYTSSSCVYGASNNMIESQTIPIQNLDTPYAITKLLGEQYCSYYSRQFGLNTAIARLFNSYGPGEHPGKYRNVIPNFFSTAIKNNSLTITGNGQETRDFTYVEDTVHGLLLIKDVQTQPSEIFNLGCGKETSILTLANEINNLVGNNSPIKFVDRRSWDDISRRVANIEKAKRILGYNPSFKLETGLEKTYYWIKKHIA